MLLIQHTAGTMRSTSSILLLIQRVRLNTFGPRQTWGNCNSNRNDYIFYSNNNNNSNGESHFESNSNCNCNS